MLTEKITPGTGFSLIPLLPFSIFGLSQAEIQFFPEQAGWQDRHPFLINDFATSSEVLIHWALFPPQAKGNGTVKKINELAIIS